MPTRNFEETDSSDILAGYSEASQLAPIDKPDIVKVLQGYKLTLGGRKNKTDKTLYQESVNAVIAWHKRRTADAAAAAARQTSPSNGGGGANGNNAAPGSGGSNTGSSGGANGSPGSYAPSYSGGGMGYRPSGGGGMPNTSVRGSMPNTSIATRPTGNRVATPMAKAPSRLPTTQVAGILRSMGAPSSWRPPTYALASGEALRAWIRRAQRQTPSGVRTPSMTSRVGLAMPRGSTGTRNTSSRSRTRRTAIRRPAYRTITR